MLAKLNTHGVCCLYAASRSSSTTPEYNKTPDVPILQPVPIKSNASAAAGAATERTQFMLPPPKAQRVFHSSTGVVDSPTNTTIRDTLIRLYSSSSDTSDTVELPNSSDVALRLQHHTAKPLKPAAAKPTHLPLSQSQNVEISRTTASPKPPCSPKPKSPVKSPALLHPEHQSVATKRASAAPRNRIAAVAGSSGKSASFDEGDAQLDLLDPPFLAPSFKNVVPDGQGHGVVERQGYYFKIFLAGPTNGEVTAGVPEAPNGGARAGDIANWGSSNCEIFWCAYAWPIQAGETGNRTFFINQEGDLLHRPQSAYTGLGMTPDFDAAYSESNMEAPLGVASMGLKAVDGGVWQ